MDVSMPIMDGLTATRQIRASKDYRLNHTVPVIALTAHAMKKNHKPFLSSGMNDVVTKPYSIAVLQQMLHRHLSGEAAGGE
jgi:CheY-like chemotaxis protein